MDKKKIARKIAEESIVLLKNADHILPLKEYIFRKDTDRHFVFRKWIRWC